MPRSHDDRRPQERVRDALDTLVVRGALDAEQADIAFAAVTDALEPYVPSPDRRRRIAEIAGYAGGAVTAAGTVLLLQATWNDLSRPARVALLSAATLAVLIVGVVIGGRSVPQLMALGRVEGSARRRLVGTLFTLAGATAAGAADAASMGDAGIAPSLAGLAVIGAGYALVPTLIGQLGGWLASAGLMVSLVEEVQPRQTVLSGLALIVLALIWAALAQLDFFTEKYSAYGVGAATGLLGAQFVLVESAYRGLSYALTALVAVACFVGFWQIRNWLVLGVGMLAVLIVVPEALNDWTHNSIASAAGLFATGVLLLIASALLLRPPNDARGSRSRTDNPHPIPSAGYRAPESRPNP